jgi:DNA-binding PucR family transcriptional regulator
MADYKREAWKQFLTPEREAEFERLGEEHVQSEISRYKAEYLRSEAGGSEYLAALYWLGEKRLSRERREKTRDRREWITLGLVFVGVVLTAITLVVTCSS